MIAQYARAPWLEQWVDFVRRATVRLRRGAVEYGNRSLSAAPTRLADELLEELEDVAAWASILHGRIRQLRDRLEKLERLS